MKTLKTDVRGIVLRWLKENGYGGLYATDPETGCGCWVGNLMPCDSICCDCRPGYLVKEIDFTPEQKEKYAGYGFVIAETPAESCA